VTRRGPCPPWAGRSAGLLLTILLTASLQPSAAQTPLSLRGAPLYIASGDRVRLTSPLAPSSLTSHAWLEGSVLAIDSLSLTIRAESGEAIAFGLDAITRLQIHRPTGEDSPSSAGATGTLVGFLAGAAVGAMACSGSGGNGWVTFLPEACGFAVGLGGALLGDRVARGGRDDGDWRPVSLPLRLALLPGRRPWLALAVLF